MITGRNRNASLYIAPLLLLNLYAQAQATLSIDSCYALARLNYPLVQQFNLIEKSREYTIENLTKASLPQLVVMGQASYQSDVTQVRPAEGAGPLPFSFPVISKDQYRLYGEAVQPLTDLFTIRQQKEMAAVSAEIEAKKVEVELHKIRERVNQLFFGVLLLDEQIEQVELIKKDIRAGMEKAKAAVENGVALSTSLDLLKAELLKAEQRAIDLKALRGSYLEMLSMFAGHPIDDGVQLTRPAPLTLSAVITRPEVKLFATQRQAQSIQGSLITAKTLPRFSLFLQGGYGRPALNMLNNDFDFYYIGGLRLNWNISTFYTLRRDRQLLDIGEQTINVQEETFVFNTKLQLKLHEGEIARLQELIRTDHEIIALRENIKSAAQNQLEYGTITALDFIEYVNAGARAQQDLSLHETQLLMAQFNHHTTTGNQ